MSKKKKIISIISAVVLVIAMSVLLFVYISNRFTLTTEVTRVGETQSIQINWDLDDSVDKIVITVEHYASDVKVNYEVINLNELVKQTKTVEAFYGKHEVTVTAYKGLLNKERVSTDVIITADEYNIAPLTGTMPTTLFSLDLFHMNDVPTFVWFKRSQAWDWSQLPENVYPMPVANYNDFLNLNDWQIEDKMFNSTSKWIEELHSLNKESKFNLYFNDYFLYGALQCTTAIGLPSEVTNINLLSDGTASFEFFNEKFNVENPDAVYESMKNDFKKVEAQVAKKGKINKNSLFFEVSPRNLKKYAYIMATENDNVNWWVTRIDGTLLTTEDFYSKVAANNSVIVKDLKSGLMALDEKQTAELKLLYNFSDDIFSQAVDNDKKVMMILGTWTKNEHHFNEYVKMTQAYYGDDYIYYYKGHPKNPTYTEPGKGEKLESLNLIDIDATIAAELIFFFNDDIYISGYSSSTFLSIPEEYCAALWNETKDGALFEYNEKMDVFFSEAGSEYNSIIIKGNDSYLIEYNDTTLFDISIFDAKLNQIRNYKRNENGFTEIK